MSIASAVEVPSVMPGDTVAASGVVTRVEITRSSGYIEIDASVEAALRACLFSRAYERKDTVGKIVFRFRLERQD